jgi:hypothetical protein
VGEQVAGGHQVPAVCRQVPAGGVLEVRQRCCNVIRESHVVQGAGVDRLQRKVPVELCRTIVVEPLVDLLAPTPSSECLLGGSAAPTKLGMHACQQLQHERGRRGLGN